MKVNHLMTTPAQTCETTTDLGTAARIMLEHNCGCLPVIDSQGHLAGMITDRDVCVAVAARHRSPWSIQAREAMTRTVFTCSPGDDVSEAMAAMSEHHVRRLPVIDDRGHLQGILSVDDIVRRCGEGEGDVSRDALLQTLSKVFAPRAQADRLVRA